MVDKKWLNGIHLGDCEELVKDLPDNSIDAIISDFPYNLGFMGKDWDTIGNMKEFFIPKLKEFLRVLKSGGWCLTTFSPRQDLLSKILVCFEEAGFKIDFTPIYWTFACGFPKAMNLSKAADKKFGVEPEIIGEKPYKINENVKGGKFSIDSKNIKENYKQGFFTKPTTKEAKKLDGSYAGHQPKPAVEVIIVTMKPLIKGSYIDQALAWCKDSAVGLGGLWFDECRIPFKNNEALKESNKYCTPSGTGIYQWNKEKQNNSSILTKPNKDGRFPANLLVSDKILDDGKKHSVSGSAKLGKKHTGGHKAGFLVAPQTENLSPNDSGGYSRFFDLDFWFANRMSYFPKNVLKIFPFLKIPKASKNEKEKGLHLDRNFHPTCKPIKLMSYMITLALGKSKYPEQRIILDPFAGTATTGVSAYLLGFKFIMFEQNKDYFKLAKERLDYYLKKESLIQFFKKGDK